MRYAKPFEPRSNVLQAVSLAILCFLAVLSTGCATQVASAPIAPPPASVMRACDPGPDIPDGEVTLNEAFAVWAARENAAAVCRAKHAALVKAWPK